MREIDFNIDTRCFDDDSVIKACYIVREYIRCEGNEECAVTKEQYDEAVTRLLTFSYLHCEMDTKVPQYSVCHEDCIYRRDRFCLGEFQLNTHFKEKVLCKHYINPTTIGY